MMSGNAGNITYPAVKGFEVAVRIDELSRHVTPHLMYLECSEHLIGVAYGV